jgi:hypothetical protein
VATVTGPLAGDPASCSLAAGSLRRLASQLQASGARTAGAGDDLDSASSGRVVRGLGRRRALLLEAAHTTAAELDRTGSLLQDHATDLAEALQELRAVESLAVEHGLDVADGRVALRWGVSGLADPSAAAALEQTRAGLQARLDSAALHLGRRRARLADSLEQVRVALAARSAELRR